MQDIATENNLSETAFIKRLSENRYQIRWFSPLTEVDFCGHATLAAAYVLYNKFGEQGDIEFVTSKVGSLVIKQCQEGEIQMNFPNQKPEPVSPPEALNLGLSKRPTQVLRNRQAYFAIYQDEQDVVEIRYDSNQLKKLAPFDVVISAPSSKFDFVSRYFWPANGGDEDPVTGSIHTGLAPYWSEILGKTELVAFQASKRGGVLRCKVNEDTVTILGRGVLYLEGKITV